MKIGILTSPDQWFIPYARELAQIIYSDVYYSHQKIDCEFDILFILAYHELVPQQITKRNKHNVVIHESDLPKGKGWSPLFWQVLHGKNEIIFSMLEASSKVDGGPIYMQKTLKLSGYELNQELRKMQAQLTMEMCLEFIEKYQIYKKPTSQNGLESFYPKRIPRDSKLDVNKTITEQFNLLRIANNEEYPAFFEINGHKYILKIEREENDK